MQNPNIKKPKGLKEKKPEKSSGIISHISNKIRKSKSLRTILLSIWIFGIWSVLTNFETSKKSITNIQDVQFWNDFLNLDKSNPSLIQKHFETGGPYYKQARQAMRRWEFDLAIWFYKKNLEFEWNVLSKIKVKHELAIAVLKAWKFEEAIEIFKEAKEENEKIMREKEIQKESWGGSNSLK